jgi:predicted phosphodiesterase
MQFIPMSDVHRGPSNYKWPFHHHDVDALFVVGDIEHPAFLRQMGKKHPDSKIIAVLGNHDFYEREWGQVTIDWWKKECAERTNVHIMEKEEIVIGDVVVLGATLWARPRPQHHTMITEQINDFHMIRKDGKKLTLEPVIAECEKTIAWLAEKLKEHAGKKVVVLTHFPPADFCVHEEYRGDPLSDYYTASLDNMLAYAWPQPAVWCFGHTHKGYDQVMGTTRFVCNPYGYYFYSVNGGFNPNLIIEV